MKAMILAAGRGARMQHLTIDKPKPLLKVLDKPLIDWQINRLVTAGFSEIVINLGYKGELLQQYLGDGSRYAARFLFSKEDEQGLETGGGVFQALPFFEDKPFLLTNADVFCDYPYVQLKDYDLATNLSHLVLVDNPTFKTQGDFTLQQTRVGLGDALTFAGISVVHPALFANAQAGRYPIAPLFREAIAQQRVSGEHFAGIWHDVGTPERLAALNMMII